MFDVEVPVISEDGLTKEVFVFNHTSRGHLEYIAHFVYNRSTKKETFSDEEKPLSLIEFCKNYDLDEYSESSGTKYAEYRDSVNPVLQKTKQGKTRAGGISAQISSLPPCSKKIADKAKVLFAKSITVRYK